MKVLVLGLGSMGKRRIRNLQHLGIRELAGFDVRSDRIEECSRKFQIQVFDSFATALDTFSPSATIISVPPDLHAGYLEACLNRNVHCFVEASVTDEDRIYRLARIADNTNLVIAPSCTMRYYSGPAAVKKLINEGMLGSPLSFTYHTGQYLPDWHPWENINDYYVSRRETGGCREIVPFELTWLNDIFGYPDVISATKAKLSDIDADIDDIYQITLRYPNRVLASLTVDVIARPEARRELFVNLERGQIVFSSHENSVRHRGINDDKWNVEILPSGTVESMYINPEEPYIREIDDFLNACRKGDPRLFPNSLLNDWTVLNLLKTIDRCSSTF